MITSIHQVDNLRAQLVKASIVLAFAVGFLLSPQLWINGRFFPVITPLEGIPVLRAPFDFILLLLFNGLSVVWVFYAHRIIGIAAIVSLLMILVQDQIRWQPWVYLYLLMLVPYLIQSNKEGNQRVVLLCLQLIVAGVYVWSGIQKLSPNFLDGPFALMVKSFGGELTFKTWRAAGYAIPLLEFSTGLSLLIPKFRKIGILTALVIHIVILFYLSPIGLNHNSIVYPWNVAMVCFVFLLFWDVKDNLFIAIREIRSNILIMLVVILVWILPILNLSGYWDHYLSFSLYSNKPSRFFIAIEKSQIHKIDKRFTNYFAEIPGLQGGQIIEIDKWAYSELNVPFYPERRLFTKLSSNFCDLGIDEDKLVFLELFYVDRKSHFSRFTCNDMKSW